eukprot:6389483-Pyramimonas_sp.AAC.1
MGHVAASTMTKQKIADSGGGGSVSSSSPVVCARSPSSRTADFERPRRSIVSDFSVLRFSP